jgi:RecB family exonuclease
LPKILSPSAIRLLIQNPYGFYVSYVLKIKSIVQKSLKTEQGILLHDLLKQLFDQDDVSEHMIDHLLLPIGDTYDERLFKFYAKSAMMFTIQNPYAHHRLTEWECQYPLSHGVTLKARIDRLDIFDDHIQVIDYKTGQIPTLKSMNEFKEPQMPLLSLITAHHFQKNVIPSFMVLGHMKDFKCQELHFDHDRVKDQLNELIDRFYGIDYCEIRIDHCTYDDFNHLKRLK